MEWDRPLEVNIWVVGESVVDLLKTWWAFCCLWNRETHAHRFILFDIWILSKDDHLQILKLCVLECVEDQVLGRVDCLRGVLMLQEPMQTRERERLEVWAQSFLPVPKTISECVEV